MKKIMLATILAIVLLVSVTAGYTLTKNIALSSTEKAILDNKFGITNLQVGECIVRDDKVCTAIATYGEDGAEHLMTAKIYYTKCIEEIVLESNKTGCKTYGEKTTKEIETEVLSQVERKLKSMSVEEIPEVKVTKSKGMNINIVVK